MSDNERGQVTDATREAEAEEAQAPHGADSPADAADDGIVDGRVVDDEVRDHYREMVELGAQDQGEGRIS